MSLFVEFRQKVGARVLFIKLKKLLPLIINYIIIAYACIANGMAINGVVTVVITIALNMNMHQQLVYS